MKFKSIQIVLIVAALGGVCIFTPMVSAETAMLWLIEGTDYRDVGECEKAIVCFDNAIALDPNFVMAYDRRGDAYECLGQYERAIEDYSKAIALDPNYELSYTGRGDVYRKLKQYERAIEDYNKAIALDPNFAHPYYGRGVAYYYLSQYERAIGDYDKVIALNPNYALAYDKREIARSKLEEQQADLIIFLVFCLAIGLSLIFIYRRGKPPSGRSTQQKPSEPDEDYAQKIEEYKEKMEEWEKKGYDVSELKDALEEVKNERK